MAEIISDDIKYSRILKLKRKVNEVMENTCVSLPSLNAEDYAIGTHAQG